MQIIWNKYYLSEWSGLKREEAYEKAKQHENEVRDILHDQCGFKTIMPTREIIVATSIQESYLKVHNGFSIVILPDLYGSHKNGRNYFVEVKRKNRRLRFRDTGFDMKYIESYLKAGADFKASVVVAFKDNKEELKKEGVKTEFLDKNGKEVWYGGFLDELNNKTHENSINTFPDPHNPHEKIKCFPLDYMKPINKIWQSRQTQLAQQRLYED